MKSDKYKITQQQANAQFWENSLFLGPNPLSSKCKAVTNYFVHTSKKEKKRKKAYPEWEPNSHVVFASTKLSCLPPHKFQKQLRFGKLQICNEH